MIEVEPIRDRNLIKKIYDFLLRKNKFNVYNKRDFILVYLGFNLGLRISDLIRLEAYQFDKTNKYLIIKERKTKKVRKILIKPKLRKIILEYIEINNITGHLFKSRYKKKNICRKTAYSILKQIEKQFELERIGTHTLRKTFGYHYYKDKGNLVGLMKYFGHASQDITLRYIGITQDEIDDDLDDFEI